MVLMSVFPAGRKFFLAGPFSVLLHLLQSSAGSLSSKMTQIFKGGHSPKGPGRLIKSNLAILNDPLRLNSQLLFQNPDVVSDRLT
jgi:hypothetical protein